MNIDEALERIKQDLHIDRYTVYGTAFVVVQSAALNVLMDAAKSARTVYIAQTNSDLTEGRGQVVELGYYNTLVGAVLAVQGKGVQGSNGEVTSFTMNPNWDGQGGTPWIRKKVYGYVPRPDGTWGYGYADGRDLPQADPEWDKYVELHNKFKGVKP